MGFIDIPSRFFYIIHSVANSGKLLQVISQISFLYMIHTTGSSSGIRVAWDCLLVVCG